MAKRKDFERILQKAFQGQAYWLLRAAGLKPRGKAPASTKTKRRRLTERLERAALDMNVRRLAAAEFRGGVDARKSWHVTRSKGFGVDRKRRTFAAWFDRSIRYKNCVCAFWAGC